MLYSSKIPEWNRKVGYAYRVFKKVGDRSILDIEASMGTKFSRPELCKNQGEEGECFASWYKKEWHDTIRNASPRQARQMEGLNLEQARAYVVGILEEETRDPANITYLDMMSKAQDQVSSAEIIEKQRKRNKYIARAKAPKKKKNKGKGKDKDVDDLESIVDSEDEPEDLSDLPIGSGIGQELAL